MSSWVWRSHGPNHTRRFLHCQRSLETPSRPGIHGNHLAAWGSASIEAFLGFCTPPEGPCPRSWSKSTAFAMTHLGSRDAHVYTRPVARGSWGFWIPPWFPNIHKSRGSNSFRSSTIPYCPKKTVVVCWFVSICCVAITTILLANPPGSSPNTAHGHGPERLHTGCWDPPAH